MSVVDDDVDVSDFVDGISCIQEFSSAARNHLYSALTDGSSPLSLSDAAAALPRSAVALVFRRGALTEHSDESLAPFHAALTRTAADNFALVCSGDSWLHQVVALVSGDSQGAAAAARRDVRAVSVRGDADLLLVLVSRCSVPDAALLAELDGTVSPAVLTDLRAPVDLLCARNEAFNAHASRDAMLAALATAAASPAPAPLTSSGDGVRHVADCVLRIVARGALSLVVFEFVGVGADVVAAVRNRLGNSGEKPIHVAGAAPAPAPTRNPNNVLRRTSSSASIFQRRLSWNSASANSANSVASVVSVASMSSATGSSMSSVPSSPPLSPSLEESSSDDDDESSDDPPPRRSTSQDVFVRVIAVRDHLVNKQRRLPFRRDEAFTVAASSMTENDWLGFHKGRRGTFPKDFVCVIHEHPVREPAGKLPPISEEE